MRPRWWPVWLRRRFPGRWTQAEIDEINRQAKDMAERLRPLWSDES